MADAVFGNILVLLEEVTSDETSIPFEYLHGTKLANLYVTGDLGGGAVVLEALAPNTGTYVPLSGVDITSPGMYTIAANAFAGRVRLEGATSAELTVIIQGSVREASM